MVANNAASTPQASCVRKHKGGRPLAATKRKRSKRQRPTQSHEAAAAPRRDTIAHEKAPCTTLVRDVLHRRPTLPSHPLRKTISAAKPLAHTPTCTQACLNDAPQRLDVDIPRATREKRITRNARLAKLNNARAERRSTDNCTSKPRNSGRINQQTTQLSTQGGAATSEVNLILVAGLRPPPQYQINTIACSFCYNRATPAHFCVGALVFFVFLGRHNAAGTKTVHSGFWWGWGGNKLFPPPPPLR